MRCRTSYFLRWHGHTALNAAAKVNIGLYIKFMNALLSQGLKNLLTVYKTDLYCRVDWEVHQEHWLSCVGRVAGEASYEDVPTRTVNRPWPLLKPRRLRLRLQLHLKP